MIIQVKINGKNVVNTEKENILLSEPDIDAFVRKHQDLLGISGRWDHLVKLEGKQSHNDPDKDKMESGRLLSPEYGVSRLWLEKHLRSVGYYYFKMLQDTERLRETNDKIKLFNLVPICDRRRYFVCIDKATLELLAPHVLIDLTGIPTEFNNARKYKDKADSILDDPPLKNYFKVCYLIEIANARRHFFQRFFKLNGIMRGDKVSMGAMIQTDGVSVSIHVDKKASEAPIKNSLLNSGEQNAPDDHEPIPDSYTYNPGDRVIANDPGRVNIFCGVEETPSGNVFRSFTRKQYYRDGHIDENNKRVQLWARKCVEGINTHLSRFSNKTSDLNKFTAHMKAYTSTFEGKSVYDELWNHYTKHRRSALRMDNYIHKTKAIDKFLNSLTKPGQKEPIIAYGGAKFAPGGKGEVSVPVKYFYKRCQLRYETKLVNEYNTTKKCHRCHERMEAVHHKEMGRTVPNNPEIRGLRRCKSTVCHGRLVSRDRNSALNILECYKAGSGNRPDYLRRAPISHPGMLDHRVTVI